MRKKRNKRGYKFTEKTQSKRGMLALALALISVIIFFAVVIESYRKRGEGSMYLGSAGVTSMLLSLVAFGVALVSLREENSFKLFPYLATTMSFFSACIWVALYVTGFILS
ncbi:MAG: DUF6142 family protein [Clostridiales bacterium]|nr:DUF6142 family protein [Clostridiales bacterium]